MSRLALKSCLVMSPVLILTLGTSSFQDLFSRQKGYLEEELDYRKQSPRPGLPGRTGSGLDVLVL